MKKMIVSLLCTLSIAHVTVISAQAEELGTYELDSYSLSINSAEVISKDSDDILVFTATFTNNSEDEYEAGAEFDYQLNVSQGNHDETKDLDTVDDFEYDSTLLSNAQIDVKANESVDFSIGYLLIDDSTIFVKDDVFLFGEDGEKFSIEIDPYSLIGNENLAITTAEEFVTRYEGKEMDSIIEAYNKLTDQSIKEQLNQQVADSTTSLYGHKVEAVGTVTEFYEGNEGYSKGSFYLLTEHNNKIRISAKNANDAVDVGEIVEVSGNLTSALNDPENLFIREASVYIVID